MTTKTSSNRRQENRPIFVVGSTRSGTSILTWCLGQHPSVLAVPESNWMGDLAIDLAMRYPVGLRERENVRVLPEPPCQNACFRARRCQHKNRLVLSLLYFSFIVGGGREAKAIASLDPWR